MYHAIFILCYNFFNISKHVCIHNGNITFCMYLYTYLQLLVYYLFRTFFSDAILYIVIMTCGLEMRIIFIIINVLSFGKTVLKNYDPRRSSMRGKPVTVSAGAIRARLGSRTKRCPKAHLPGSR